jgi:hypothetical protein
MPKSKSTPADPEQSKRFIETAKALETDERPEEFERVFSKVATPSKPTPSDHS